MSILKNQKHEVTYDTETKQIFYNKRNFNTTPFAERTFIDAGTSEVGPSVEPVPSYFTYDIYNDGVHGDGIRLKRFDDSLENVVIASQYSHEGQVYDIKYLYGGVAASPWQLQDKVPGLFESTNIVSVTIPNTVFEISSSSASGGGISGVFYNCASLITIIFEEDSQLISMDNYALYNCTSLTNIEIPSSVISIGNYAFSGCTSLTSIEIPSGVTSIGNSAFWNCSSLTSIGIPSGVTSIGELAFVSCSSLTSIEIPASVTNIGYRAFYNCSSLTSIEIPLSATNIGDGAFRNCSSLTNITYLGTMSQWSQITLGTGWNSDVPATVVHCSDGDVTL